MKAYKRLDMKEREEISRCLVMGYRYRDIAKRLNRSVSTISREINNNGHNRFQYRAVNAEKQARTKNTPKRRKLDTNRALQKIVTYYLQLRWSPEQIAKRLKVLYADDMKMQISHESIYAYIYVHPRHHLKRQLLYCLRRKHKYRWKQKKERKTSQPIREITSIEERPVEINSRKLAGHWEGDLVMGSMNRTAIGTLVERKTRLTLIVKLIKKDATSVRKAFTRKFAQLPSPLKQSLTYDQGQEMAEHRLFTQKTKIKVYFAHAHSPWERGTSENTNSLIRDFFPKGTDFSNVTARQLKKVQDMLNDRPRKVLHWYTPNEVFTKAVAFET